MSISPRFKDFEQLRDSAAAALRRWARKVQKSQPGTRLEALRGADNLVSVVFHEDHIALFAPESGEAGAFGSISRRDTDEVSVIASLLAATSGMPGQMRDVRLQLPGDQVLQTSLRMPAATSRTLDSALRFELPRLSPLDPGQIYFDFSVGTPDPRTNKAEISVRIFRRSIVDQARALCHAAGLRIAAIGFTGQSPDADWRHFPVDRDAFARLQWRRWGAAALSGLALALAVMVIAAMYMRGNASLDDLSGRLAREQERAEYAIGIERRIASIESQARFLADEKHGPMFVSVLADLTRLLPDGTWLTDVQMHGKKVRIMGYSPNASSLIGTIDRSPSFRDAQFEAPVMQSQINNTERFDLSFVLKDSKP